MAMGAIGLQPSCLIYVEDHSLGLRFLVDTGAEVSVIPPHLLNVNIDRMTLVCRHAMTPPLQLSGNNSSPPTLDSAEHLMGLYCCCHPEPSLGCWLPATLQPPSGCETQLPTGHTDTASGPKHCISWLIPQPNPPSSKTQDKLQGCQSYKAKNYTRLQLRWSDICAWSLSISVCTCTVSSSTQHSAGDPGSPCQQSRHPATCGESASPPQFPLTHPWVQPLWVSWFHQILLLLYLTTILSDPKPSAPMSIISNTSDIAMGAVLQQPIRRLVVFNHLLLE